MKKLYIYITGIFLLLIVSACENPMYDGVITYDEYVVERDKVSVSIVLEKSIPVYIQFTENGIQAVEEASDAWHISSKDASWRMSSNSGTTRQANGGVISMKGVSFEDIRKVEENADGTATITNASGERLETLNPNSEWEIDKNWTYAEGEINATEVSANYYLTDPLTSETVREPSGSYLFSFIMDGMQYISSEDNIFIVKDGSGGNYVKIMPIEITTDNPGDMSYTKRIYVFIYEMANASGEFGA